MDDNIQLKATGIIKKFGDDVVLNGIDLSVKRKEHSAPLSQRS